MSQFLQIFLAKVIIFNARENKNTLKTVVSDIPPNENLN